MKRPLAILLCLVMLLTLAACGKDDTQTTDPSTESSQSTTDSTEATTDTTTDATQAPTEEPTTAPTEGTTTESTEAPSTKPTETPTTKPAACSHSYKEATCTTAKTCTKCGATSGSALGHSYKAATCTAPKTCSKCGATEGSAAGHSWNAATCSAPKTCSKCGATNGSALGHNYVNGVCSCGDRQIANIPFDGGKWCLDALSGTQLNRMSIICSEGTGYLSVSFWGEEAVSGTPYSFNGKNYYNQGFGKGADLTYTESGDTVVIEVSAYGGLNLGTLTLSRTAADQYTVTGVTGTIISDSITRAITVGSVFTGTAIG